MILGAAGRVGRAAVRAARERGAEAIGLVRADVDVTDRLAVREAIASARADLVLNAAGYTAVDRAESEPGAAYRVNRDGAANVAEACADADVPVIHLSTDYVFDGRLGRPYVETDPPNPLGVYGASKRAGEEAVASTHPRHLIVRTAWLFGAGGGGFVDAILRRGREGAPVRVVDDQTGNPTSVEDLVETVWTMAEAARGGAGPWGLYHWAGAGATTWHGFAAAILEAAAPGAGPPEPVSSAAYGAAAPRPRYAALDCAKAERAFGVRRRPWRDALREALAAREGEA